MNLNTSLKVIVAGGRDFDDYERLSAVLDEIYKGKHIEIVCGDARGADRLGAIYAAERGLTIHHFPADWGTYGRAAGPRRNTQMAKFADEAVVFWDGESRGSKNMISTAKRLKVPVRVESY